MSCSFRQRLDNIILIVERARAKATDSKQRVSRRNQSEEQELLFCEGRIHTFSAPAMSSPSTLERTRQAETRHKHSEMSKALVPVLYLALVSAVGSEPLLRTLSDMPRGKDAVTVLLSGNNTNRLKKLSTRMNATSDSIMTLLESDDTLHLDSNTLDNADGPEIFFMEVPLNASEDAGARRRGPGSGTILDPEREVPRMSETLDELRVEKGKDPEVNESVKDEDGVLLEDKHASTRKEINRRFFHEQDAFKLHSNPGASRILFLDFDGHDLTNTAWSKGTRLVAPPCDWDGNPLSFSDAEKGYIKKIHYRVSEDFAPFDVDVTTELQNEDQITRSSQRDKYYGNRILIAPGIASLCNKQCGGVSYVGIYARKGEVTMIEYD